MDKKAVWWPVVISVLIHLTVLSVAGMIDLSENIQPVEVLAVSLGGPEPEESPAPKKEYEAKEKTKAVESTNEKRTVIHDDGWREDTIDLGSLDIKYVNYLTRVKNKLLKLWQYPQQSYQRNEEGNSVVKMSIDADGRLSAVTLVSSSGYEDLDHAALGVVQMAAPFEPLPAFYNLSRLNIVASFEYKIMD